MPDNYDPIHQHEDKWYFWNESGDLREGPFDTEEGARFGLICYVNYLNGECVTCSCKFDPDNYYEMTDGVHQYSPVCASCAKGIEDHAAFVERITRKKLHLQLSKKVK